MQQGQLEAGSRYVEAVAAGAVPVGEGPGAGREWSRFVTSLGETTEAAEAIRSIASRDDLEAQQAEMIAAALSSMDWGHRWKAMLETLGREPSPAVLERIQRLEVEAVQMRHSGRRA
jgi:hypothetical protein